MCGIDFIISVRFFFEKLKDSVRNEFGSVKKMQFGLDVSYLLLTRVIAEQLIYSKYYSDSGWHDFDVTHNDNK